MSQSSRALYPKVFALLAGAIILGSVAYYSGENAGASGVKTEVSSELKGLSPGSRLLGSSPDYSAYIDSLMDSLNAQQLVLQNLSAKLKATNSQLQEYASLPYNSTNAAEIQRLTSQSQSLQTQLQLAMTQLNQQWTLVASILQSLNQTYQSINSTVRSG